MIKTGSDAYFTVEVWNTQTGEWFIHTEAGSKSKARELTQSLLDQLNMTSSEAARVRIYHHEIEVYQ